MCIDAVLDRPHSQTEQLEMGELKLHRANWEQG